MTFSRPSSHDNTSEPNVELRGENVFAHGLTHGNYFVASRTCRRNTIHTSKSLLITVSRMVFNAFLFPPPPPRVRSPPSDRSLSILVSKRRRTRSTRSRVFLLWRRCGGPPGQSQRRSCKSLDFIGLSNRPNTFYGKTSGNLNADEPFSRKPTAGGPSNESVGRNGRDVLNSVRIFEFRRCLTSSFRASSIFG